MNEKPNEYRTFTAPAGPRRLVTWFVGAVLLAHDALFWGAVVEAGGFAPVAYAVAVLLPAHLVWLYVVERMHRVVEVGPEGLRVRGWWGLRFVPADRLTGVEDDPALMVYVAGGRHRIRLGDRDREAAVAAEMRRCFPWLPTRTQRWISEGLPLQLRRRPSNRIGTVGIGFGVSVLLLIPGVYALFMAARQWLQSPRTGEVGADAGSGAVLVSGALLFAGVTVIPWVARWEFGAEHIAAHRLWRVDRRPVAALRSIALRSEEREHRGHSRTCWVLELEFDAPHPPLTVEPGENGLQFGGFSPLADRTLLTDLRSALVALYGLSSGGVRAEGPGGSA